MFEMKYIGHGSGMDVSTYYEIIFDKSYTVQEFIEAVLRVHPDEWGYFVIDEGKYFFENPRIDYKYGELELRFSEEILHKTILSAKADGGWSMMNYSLKIQQ